MTDVSSRARNVALRLTPVQITALLALAEVGPLQRGNRNLWYSGSEIVANYTTIRTFELAGIIEAPKRSATLTEFGRSVAEELRRNLRKCAAENCSLLIPASKFMCPGHWSLVPRDAQEAVADAYAIVRAKDVRGHAIWQHASERAIAEVSKKEDV